VVETPPLASDPYANHLREALWLHTCYCTHGAFSRMCRDYRILLFESNSHPDTVGLVRRRCGEPATSDFWGALTFTPRGREKGRGQGRGSEGSSGNATGKGTGKTSKVLCVGSGLHSATKTHAGDQSSARLTAMARMRNVYLRAALRLRLEGARVWGKSNAWSTDHTAVYPLFSCCLICNIVVICSPVGVAVCTSLV